MSILCYDDEYQGTRIDCIIDPDNQTIILPASFLNTLALGEHSFEAYFTEPDSGSARASFKIIEEIIDDDDDEGETVPVPSTGVFTSEGGSAEMINDFTAAIVVIETGAVANLLIKKARQV